MSLTFAPIVWHPLRYEDGGTECSCGHTHYPGSRVLERHRHRLLGRRVVELWTGWPLGTIVFREAPR